MIDVDSRLTDREELIDECHDGREREADDPSTDGRGRSVDIVKVVHNRTDLSVRTVVCN